MTPATIAMAPARYARIAGLFYLLEALTATFGQIVVLGRLTVRGDAAATAANILQHQTLFRLGFASSLVAVVFHAAWALLFYALLAPVRRSIAAYATFVVLVGCAMQAVAGILYAAPLTILRGGPAAGPFSVDQLQALAFMFLRLNAVAFNAYLVFFGVWCALVGWLIIKSTFLPRWIGTLMVIAGLAYLILLWPPLARSLHPFNLALSAPGEISLLVWLLVRGVDEQEWMRSGVEDLSEPHSSDQVGG